MLKREGRGGWPKSLPLPDLSRKIEGYHMARNKKYNRKHSKDELKNLAFDRFLTCKKPCKDLTLCNFSHMKYSEKCFNQIYRALYGDANMAAVKVLKQLLMSFAIKSIT